MKNIFHRVGSFVGLVPLIALFFCLCVSFHFEFVSSTTSSSTKPHTHHSTHSPWTWVCRDEQCVKIARGHGEKGDGAGVPVAVCKLNCGRYGAILPRPTGKVHIGKHFFHFHKENVGFAGLPPENHAVPALRHLFQEGQKIFMGYLGKLVGKNREDVATTSATVTTNSDAPDKQQQHHSSRSRTNKVLITLEGVWTHDDKLTLQTDESYELAAHHDEHDGSLLVTIHARSYCGARHGLETFSQLIAWDEEERALVTPTHFNITDRPAFPYRGLLLDTSRNFYSIQSIKRLISGMSYVKLNMFHWHLTDTHSFPFESKRNPKLTQYGAYSKDQVYTVEDMKAIVAYARARGVKVVPEFDQPAHVGNGWQMWPEADGHGELALCVNKEPWQEYCVEPPCGQLNVVNEHLLPILENLYKDFLEIFDHDLFHMGGDEINYKCWNSSAEIRNFLLAEGNDLSQESFIDLWGRFQEKAYDQLKTANHGHDITPILWTSDLTDEKYIERYLDNSRYIIQIWSKSDDKSIASLINSRYRVILANYDAWYLDCGYGGWVGAGPNNWCSPYKGWQQVYANSPIGIYANLTSPAEAVQAYEEGLILGGSAQLWSEQADEQSADSKIWPRGAALAERLWSNPVDGWDSLEYRMISNRERMVQRGIHADALQPAWCYQNEGHCYLKPEKPATEPVTATLY